MSFLERVSGRTVLSGDRLAPLHRGGLRIFYACDSGGLADLQTTYVQLERRVDGATDIF